MDVLSLNFRAFVPVVFKCVTYVARKTKDKTNLFHSQLGKFENDDKNNVSTWEVI